MRAGPRIRLYRFVMSRFVWPGLAGVFLSKERRAADFGREAGTSWGQAGTAWFHAASAGELEGLWPVIEAWAAEGRPCVVTVFSESARARLSRLEGTLRVRGSRLLYSGYCPREGNWSEAIRQSGSAFFVTAKYEAWPDLWMGLAECGVPLVVVGARDRRSFRICKGVLGLLGSALPPMVLLAAEARDLKPLVALFPAADVRECGDPRWDQVAARMRTGNVRSREIAQVCSGDARPWGILAQVWKEDLDFWRDELKDIPGTVFIVPHRVEDSCLNALSSQLRVAGLKPVAPGGKSSGGRSCVLIGEMGVLTELYAAMDWAYVGGGFGKGVHSTIEPALYGVPVSVGPAGADKFPEVEELKRQGQLEVIRQEGELRSWLHRNARVDADSRQRRSVALRSKLGATGRILQMLREKAGSAMLP